MLRTKERSEYAGGDPVEVTVKLISPYQKWNPPWCKSGSDTFYTPLYRERFERIRTDDDGPKTEWKPCQHYKRWVGYDEDFRPGFVYATRNGTEIPKFLGSRGGVDPFLFWTQPVPILKYGPFGDHIQDLPSINNQLVGSADFIQPPPNLQQLVDHSLAVMLPSIGADISAINFVLELDDLNKLPATISRLKTLAGSLSNSVLRRLPGKSKFMRDVRRSFIGSARPTMAEAVRTGADSYLATEFGVRPLLSDLCGIWTAMDTLNKRINALITHEGRVRVRHFQTTFPVPEFGYSSQLSTAFTLSSGQFTGVMTHGDDVGELKPWRKLYVSARMGREVYLDRAQFHAQMKYSYHLSGFQKANVQILAAMDSLGINLNPAILWNAIPWSFVVDWFVGIGPLLEKLKTENLKPRINIYKYLWSYKFRRMVRTYVQHDGALPYKEAYRIPKVYFRNLYEEAYRRDVGIPVSSSLITSGLSSKELSLGLALLVPKKRRSNPRLSNANRKQ